MIHYSPFLDGFLDDALWTAALPGDAVQITPSRHRELVDARALGRTIVINDAGRPVLAPVAVAPIGELIARAQARRSDEAERRILADWPIARQLNVEAGRNAVLAACLVEGRQPTDLEAEALSLAALKDATIAAIRASSAALAGLIPNLDRANLEALDVAANIWWPA